MPQPKNMWLEEHHEDFLIQKYRVKETLFHGTSEY